MANLLSRVRGKTFYLIILSVLFISGCNDDDQKEEPVVETNSAPVITSAATATAPAGSLFIYTLTASDADGDTVNFRASILPSWLTFNAATGELSGTPARDDEGDYQVTLSASDGVDSTPLFLDLSVVIVNIAPTVTSVANKNGVVGNPYSYTLTATDVDGDPLVTSIVSTLPDWATFDADSGTISGTPDVEGDIAIELSVSDGELSTNQQFTLVITSVPSVVIGFDETVDFNDFGGAVTEVIANPDQSGINQSENVARMQKFDGEVFAGSTITFDAPFNLEANVQNRQLLSSASFSGMSIAANNIFKLKVWSQRQVALTFKLEGDTDANDVERVVSHDGTGWEVLSFDFTGVSGTGYTAITLIFDNGVAGDAADDAANWTFYFDDMVIPFVAEDNGGGTTFGPELVANGNFDAGFTNWNEIGQIVMEDGNSFFQADVQAAGNAFDVSLMQGLALTPDSDYVLTFRAKASVARSMIAGIGLNYAPWTNAAETVAMTTEWQTFTIAFTTDGFGDADNRVFFDMGAEVGVVSIDDVSLKVVTVDDGSTGGGNSPGPEIAVNGGFDAGFASWNEIGLIVMEDGNNIFQADVQAAGNAFDVSLQQVLALEADKDYILTFKAKASVARGMIAGIGLNYAPWTNAAETVAMTTEWQTFTINLTTTGFGDANNRVFFDMGAEVGVVSIDDVSLKLAAVDDNAGGGDTGGQLTNNGDFEVGDLSGWDAAENGGSITVDNTQDSGSTWVANVVAGPGNNPALSQAGLAVGTVMPGDTIDISFDMCGTAASGGVIFPALLSEFGNGTGADRQTLETIAVPPSVWTRYNYSAVAGNNVTGGVSLQLDVVCGGDAACSADVYFDNVSVTIDGGVAPGEASGNSCVAGDAGGGDDGTGGTPPDGEVAVNGGFENGYEGWSQVGSIVTEGDNNFLQVEVATAGDPWSVNLSQVVTLVQDADYVLSFKAKASVSRAIIAGIGQNSAPFMSATENVALSTEWVAYSLNLTAAGFGGADSRILFDMGAEVGTVSIDDVSLTLASGDTGGGSDPVEPLVVELVVFDDAALPEWAAWINDGGTTEVLQDGENGAVTKFTLTAPSVAGFTSRDGGGAVNGMTFDASALTNGIITFDFKMVKEPDAGLVDWKFKVESSTGEFADVSLSASYEGHAAPALDTWQTYSFSISALADAGLDTTNIDLFMVFPDYNSAPGAEFYLDNFKITSGGEVPARVASSSESGGDLVIDVAAGIDFEGTEAEQASWNVFENVSNPALEFVANPSSVGNTTPQVAKITLETAAAGSGRFAGAVTRTVQEFALNSSNAIVKIWVYKDKISPVGVKFEKFNGDGYGSHGELTVSNTKVNEWEQLTIDFTNQIGLPENDAITGIAIFPDMVDGRTATVAYFDEITFTAN